MIVLKDKYGYIHIEHNGKKAFFQEECDVKFIENQLKTTQAECLDEGYSLDIPETQPCYDVLHTLWRVNTLSEKEREEQLNVI